MMSESRERMLNIEAGAIYIFFFWKERYLSIFLVSKEEITTVEHYRWGKRTNNQNSRGETSFKYRLRKEHRKEKGDIIHSHIYSHFQKPFIEYQLCSRHCCQYLKCILEENKEACPFIAYILARLVRGRGHKITKNTINT